MTKITNTANTLLTQNDRDQEISCKPSMNPEPSRELLEAIQEGEDILNGKIKAKGYHNVKKMIADILKRV